MKTCDALEKKARAGQRQKRQERRRRSLVLAKMVKKKTGDEKDSRSSASLLLRHSVDVAESIEINSLVVCENRDGEKIHLTTKSAMGKT